MKTIVIATAVTAAALLTGCAGVPTDTASLRDSAAQPFRFVAEKLGGAQPITARQGDVTVKWRPDPVRWLVPPTAPDPLPRPVCPRDPLHSSG